MYAFCLSCRSATFAHQYGGFVPREWLPAKGLFEAGVQWFFRLNLKYSQKPTQKLTLAIWLRVTGDAHITRVAQYAVNKYVHVYHRDTGINMAKRNENYKLSAHNHVRTVAHRYHY